MDTSSARDVARSLGTSAPRVLRAARELGLPVEPRSPARFTAVQAQALIGRLGVDAKVEGLTVSQARALAALSRAPRGLTS